MTGAVSQKRRKSVPGFRHALFLSEKWDERMKKRFRYTFAGEVQGVGFRYRACHAAGQLGLTGWVRNEYDGSVTMEVQGDRAAIDAMLGMIESGRYIRIDNAEAKELPPVPEERTFGVRY